MSSDEELREPPQPATAAGLDPGGGQPSAEAMTIQQLMVYLTHQNQAMAKMMAMLQHDRPEPKEKNHLANVKLDERNFRSVSKFNNTRSGWREWERQFMAAVRECDVDFANFTWAYEQREKTVDHIHDFNPTQSQLAVNLHSRLIAATTGTAFQIVESVGRYNGVEAWRFLNFQFNPKTDARLTTLVLNIIGHKIKGKDVQAGLVLWEAQMLALERDRQETLSPKI